MRRIAVVGGGPGGLLSAFLLERKSPEPLAITLFEAEGRVGGKVQTKQFRTAPVLYEAGAAELYRYGRDPLWRLVRKTLNLTVVPMIGKTVVLNGRILRTKADIRDHFGSKTLHALRKFSRQARAMRSFRSFYDSGWPEDNEHPWAKRTFAAVLAEVRDVVARQYLEVLLHADLATELPFTSALYGLDNYLINNRKYCRLYSIKGSLERLIKELRVRLGAEIRLNTVVERIEREATGKYCVSSRHAGRIETASFDLVVVALPNYWLPTITWGGNDLAAAMVDHHAHYNSPGHYLRVTALFKRQFWREAIPGSYFHLDAFGGCCVYDEGARHDSGPYGVLGWLIGGSHALALSHCSDQTLVDKALDSLPGPLAVCRGLFLEGHVHRWVGAVSGQPGGRFLKGSKRRHVPEPYRHPGLVVVGDYLFDSTINGVLDSADIASDLLIRQMKEPTVLKKAYFDYYYGKKSYAKSFKECFDARYVLDLIAAVWGAKPPYRLLDVGSANGLTLAAFAKRGVVAWGVENNPYIHAQTPRRLRERNLAGDVRDLPFPDGHFDFAYETCLCYVPEQDLERAIRELYRVTRRGIIFGSIVKDLRKTVVEYYDAFYGVKSLMTLAEWSEYFLRCGFQAAVTDPRVRTKVWRIEKESNDGEPWYRSAKSMTHCFYTK